MRKKSATQLIFVLSIALTLTSCDKLALFDAGDTITREVHFEGSISAIDINSIFEIVLVQDTINKALITCGENLQHDINIELKKSILYLSSTVKYNWSRNYEKVKLELHLISIPRLDVRKPSYIATRDTFKTYEFFLIDWGKFTELDATLDTKSCYIDASSLDYGKYTVKGRSINATFYCNGSSFIYANDLKVQYCTVKQKSIGDVYVNVSDALSVTIENTGRVFYYGNPSTIEIKNSFPKERLIHLTNK